MILLLHSGVVGDRQGHSKGQWLRQSEIGLRLSPTLPLPVQTLTSSSHKYPESPSSVSPETINLHTLANVRAHDTESSKTSHHTPQEKEGLLQDWDILVLNLHFVVFCNKQCGNKPKTSRFFLRNFFLHHRKAGGRFARNSKAIGTGSLPAQCTVHHHQEHNKDLPEGRGSVFPYKVQQSTMLTTSSNTTTVTLCSATVSIRVSQKKSLNYGTPLTPLVLIGQMSHQNNFQHYRPINGILTPISSFTL